MLSETYVDAHARLMDWFEENRPQAAPDGNSQFIYSPISTMENDNFKIVPIPPAAITKPLQESIQAALEKWVGFKRGALEPTKTYDTRLYRRNARLRWHVDTPDDRVLGAILRIGQRGLLEPWPL